MFLRKKNERITRFNQHQQNFKNPYFENKKNKSFSWQGLINFIFYFSLSVLTGILLYLFLYSNLFAIKDLEFVGNFSISDYELKNYYQDYLKESNSFFFADNNILFFDSNGLEDYIMMNNNFIQSVGVLKNGRNLLSIQIQEKEIVGYWKSANDLYSFDKVGNVINILNENGGLVNQQQEYKNAKYYGSINMAILAKYPMIIDNRYHSLSANEHIPLDDQKIQMILKIFNFVNKKNLFLISSFSFADNIYQNLIIKTLDDYLLYFSLIDESALDESLNRLAIFLQEASNAVIINNLEYIDLRIPEKVFYK